MSKTPRTIDNYFRPLNQGIANLWTAAVNSSPNRNPSATELENEISLVSPQRSQSESPPALVRTSPQIHLVRSQSQNPCQIDASDSGNNFTDCLDSIKSLPAGIKRFQKLSDDYFRRYDEKATKSIILANEKRRNFSLKLREENRSFYYNTEKHEMRCIACDCMHKRSEQCHLLKTKDYQAQKSKLQQHDKEFHQKCTEQFLALFLIASGL